MKKILVTFTFLICGQLFSQTVATDWTSNDCAGNSHNLFTELNQGKVIVLVWAMPCGLCIAPALTSYNVKESFSTSSCDVEYFLIDDYGNTNCTTLTNWANTNGIGPNIYSFSNALIDMTAYGVQSMPKVVVVGGAGHTVYSIQNNAVNATTLQNAITQACADIAAGVKDVSQNINSLSVFPNPASEKTTISFSLETAGNLSMEICDLLGTTVKKIKQGSFPAGEQKIDMTVKDLNTGIYFLRVTEGNRSRVVKFIVQK